MLLFPLHGLGMEVGGRCGLLKTIAVIVFLQVLVCFLLVGLLGWLLAASHFAGVLLFLLLLIWIGYLLCFGWLAG